MALITCDNAAFAYDAQVVLSGVSFTVEAGDYLCIVGENGSGKSTLMKGLLRLVTPVRGSVTLGDGLTRDRIGYLPQQTQTQKDFPASVLEVAESGLRGYDFFPRREDRRRVMGLLETLEASHLAGRSFMELSGGQKQRVLLARALAGAGKVLLMDEPTAGLDPLVAREMYRIIGNINREHGIAVVMISHDVGTAVRHARSILHLRQTPVFFGPTAEYLMTAEGQRYVGGVCDD
ncbi:MAG TPA: ABC transporter ATP-binding protein [Candidatus Limnocylindria bacterium]|nr:ABC transporter ATP-binding protein [Candidatus Limnocylindria bacterium]